jgi:hypothetical protein
MYIGSSAPFSGSSRVLPFNPISGPYPKLIDWPKSARSRHAQIVRQIRFKWQDAGRENPGQPPYQGESKREAAWRVCGLPRSIARFPSMSRHLGPRKTATKSAIFPRKIRSMGKPGSFAHTSTLDRSSTSHSMRFPARGESLERFLPLASAN